VIVALMVGLAGCGGFGSSGDAAGTESEADGGGGGTSCGPGETEISAAPDAEGQVSITGEVIETGNASFVIDDGTASAFIQRPGNVSQGDCVTVDGYVFDTGDMPGADVTVQASNVTQN